MRGHRLDDKNLFQWDYLRMNLPGSKTFNPLLPWTMKWNVIIGNIACKIMAYVDDLHITGIDEEMVWAAARQVASRLQYLGVQDAARKTKAPGIDTGSAWAGTIF